jgi:hypothetical protein
MQIIQGTIDKAISKLEEHTPPEVSMTSSVAGGVSEALTSVTKAVRDGMQYVSSQVLSSANQENLTGMAPDRFGKTSSTQQELTQADAALAAASAELVKAQEERDLRKTEFDQTNQAKEILMTKVVKALQSVKKSSDQKRIQGAIDKILALDGSKEATVVSFRNEIVSIVNGINTKGASKDLNKCLPKVNSMLLEGLSLNNSESIVTYINQYNKEMCTVISQSIRDLTERKNKYNQGNKKQIDAANIMLAAMRSQLSKYESVDGSRQPMETPGPNMLAAARQNLGIHKWGLFKTKDEKIIDKYTAAVEVPRLKK